MPSTDLERLARLEESNKNMTLALGTLTEEVTYIRRWIERKDAINGVASRIGWGLWEKIVLVVAASAIGALVASVCHAI